MECKFSVVPTGRFISEVRISGTHWMRDWVGFRAGVDVVEKIKPSCPCLESNHSRPANTLVTTTATLSANIIVFTRFIHANATEYKLTWWSLGF